MIKERGRLKYSFVLPAYNIEKYIAACINSIALQGKQIEKIADFEIIVINDGSTDRTLEAAYECATKDSHVVVLPQQNKGPSATRNTGNLKYRLLYLACMALGVRNISKILSR